MNVQYLQNVVLSIKKRFEWSKHTLFVRFPTTNEKKLIKLKLENLYVCVYLVEIFWYDGKICKLLPLQSTFPWVST